MMKRVDYKLSFRVLMTTLSCVALVNTAACSLSGLVDADGPESMRELPRDYLTSREGALGMYYGALGILQEAVMLTSFQVSLFTDELTIGVAGNQSFPSHFTQYDARVEAVQSSGGRVRGVAFRAFRPLHQSRVRALQARTVLQNLGDSSLRALIANTYTIEGYSILLLAENMCSGIPLTHVPFDGPVEYDAGHSTAEALTIAIAKFDSALAIVHDSARYTTLARIGKGRAYLNLGDTRRAAEAVTNVPADAVYLLHYTDRATPGGKETAAFWATTRTITVTVAPIDPVIVDAMHAVNGEGRNGMVWYRDPAQLDPRVPVTTTVVDGVKQFPAIVRQRKFVNPKLTFPLARWVEAKMIEAEHALSLGKASWIDPLNAARRSVGLQDTTSPETVGERLRLLFRERAYWFYLEGVRLSDYRRLVRQYGQDPYLVYPVGPYTLGDGAVSLYGDAYVLSPESDEIDDNGRYRGCQNKAP